MNLLPLPGHLISKKFLVTLLTLVWLLAAGEYHLATWFAGAYVGVQGTLDGLRNKPTA